MAFVACGDYPADWALLDMIHPATSRSFERKLLKINNFFY
jgi:hypothetical protein